MPKAAFKHVDVWVFDLDNTLYPPAARLFDQIEARMTGYVMHALSVEASEADRLRKLYWREHGTTLAGLMTNHRLDPTPYLDHVHDIDLSGLSPDTALIAAIEALAGRKIVHTNGSREHARRVLAATGLSHVFDNAFGVEDAGYTPKPAREAFEKVLGLACIDPASAAMIEDDARNLEAPHAMGMRTIWACAKPDARSPGAHVHHMAADLPGFLSQLS